MKRWMIAMGIGLAVFLGAAGALAYQWVRPYPLPDVPKGITRTQVGLDFERERNMIGQPFVLVPDSPAVAYADLVAQVESKEMAVVERTAAALQAALRSDPDNLVLGNLLRVAMIRLERPAELVEFYASLPATSPEARVQKALAMVDGLQNPDLAAASLGQLSLRSIQELDGVLAEEPYHFLARLTRGLNNLYWPLGMRRIDKAVSDLGYAVSILETFPSEQGRLAEMAYSAYGDALVKAGKVSEGSKVWRRGLERLPDSQELQLRVEQGEESALTLVQRERGIDTFTRPDPRMTDLTVLWDPSRNLGQGR